MRNYFILDGVDSRDFGVYISGQGTFNASGRDYNIIPVPGRNGDLVGPEKRFANGTLTYPAFIYSNFKQNIEAFRNFLLSLVGYHDLVDSYHPDQIRKVLFQGPFNVDVQTKNDAGRFDIEFICKPQRFLASGNEVTTFESAGETETFSGSVVTFDNSGDATVSALSTAINPVQDLHGYSNPWPAGGGKNLFNFDNLTLNRVSISGTADNFVLTGTDESYNRAEYNCIDFAGKTVYVSAKGTRTGSSRSNTFLATQYTLNGTTYNGGVMTGQKQYNSSGVSDTTDAVMLFPEGVTAAKLFIYVNNASSGGVGLTSTVEGLRICAAQNETWVPFSNICPISGFSAANIVVSPTQDAQDGTTYTVQFGAAGTVYGGTLDVTAGTLTVTHGQIASYAGEALPGAWISDRDAYAVGTTPTTGAQVVYELASAQTYTLTPTEVQLLLGTNNVWSDTGDITATIAFPQEQFTITNPTLFDSQPFLRVYGTGTLGIGSQSVTITQADGYTDIDCEMMDCYKGTDSKNGFVELSNHLFPVLKPGENIIELDGGITKVELTPRWWIV